MDTFITARFTRQVSLPSIRGMENDEHFHRGDTDMEGRGVHLNTGGGHVTTVDLLDMMVGIFRISSFIVFVKMRKCHGL